jgi:hypothetical protein
MKNRYLRTFCKTCDDFVFHEEIFYDQAGDKRHLFKGIIDAESESFFEDIKKPIYVCNTCNTVFTPYNLRYIDKEKIEAQRQRFKAQRRSNFHKTMNLFSMIGFTNSFPDLKEGKYFEADAGLEREEELRRQIVKERKEMQQAELQKFKDVGRNDKCLCGSGKKYKKCCLAIHSEHGYGKGY